MGPCSHQQVQSDIREFRRYSGQKAHLPEPLRKAAAQLAASEGVGKISQELAINRASLQRWVRLGFPAVKAAALPIAPTKTIEFVEIKAPRSAFRPEGLCPSIEVTRPDGWTVRVSGDLAKDVAASILGKFSL